MFDSLSLRSRLTALLCLSVCVALIPCGVAWIAFSQVQITDEQEVGRQIAGQLAETLNRALSNSPASHTLIDAFASEVPQLKPGLLDVVRTDDLGRLPEAPLVTSSSVPNWFARRVADRESVDRFPLFIDGRPAAYLVYVSESSLDVYEKWVGFIAIGLLATWLVAMCCGLAYWKLGVALRPLDALATNLKRMRNGFYGVEMTCVGPPEFRESFYSLNQLSSRLQQLIIENRMLLRRMIAVQDKERSELSRELHDEMGPILFAIRASATALGQGQVATHDESSLARLMEAVELLQRANRRVLDRLRPMHLEQLGLSHGIDDIVRNVKAQRSNLTTTCDLAADLDALDSVLAQTVYRVIQEATTNGLRHTNATAMTVKAAIPNGTCVLVSVSDNGSQSNADFRFGRGLTGMLERVQALGGTLTITRKVGWTVLSCQLPLSSAAPEAAA